MDSEPSQNSQRSLGQRCPACVIIGSIDDTRILREPVASGFDDEVPFAALGARNLRGFSILGNSENWSMLNLNRIALSVKPPIHLP